uniref:Ubiquitinyl hydrolase 1 n=1 Tax=Phaeomonas parva TaxID=124430 RepID=A0A7S1TTF1_9STRA
MEKAGGARAVPASEPRVTPAAEANAVRELMRNKTMGQGDQYHVISFRWWQAWVQYTGYEEPQEDTMDTSGERPGPLNAAELVSPTFEAELKPALVEDYDYKLLPLAVYNKLEGWYGAEQPRFQRTAINRASQPGLVDVIVELYPVRGRVGIVGDNGQPTGEYEYVLLSRQLTVAVAQSRITTVADSMIKRRADNPNGVVPMWRRIWYKSVFDEPAETADAGDGERADVNSDGYVVVNEENGAAADNAEESEEEALAYVLFDDKSASTRATLLDLLDAGPVRLEIRAEYKGSFDDPWPRESVLNAWKLRLKQGDEIDAVDTEGNWYEALVMGREEIDGKINVKVHFMGWGHRWDDDIDVTDSKAASRITKRNVQVEFWRNFAVGDNVELKDHKNNKNPTWYSGEIEQIRDEGEDEDLSTTSKDGKAIDPLQAEEAALPGKRLLVVANTSQREPMYRWVCAQGEHICKMYTHLKEDRHQPKPRASYSSGGSSGYGYGGTYGYDSGTRGRPPVAGAVGLRNLGNTCFMNSMLQCISHTPQLTSFFLGGEWRKDVNKDNPLGMNGKLATVYADFLKDVWGGNHTVVAPTGLKRTVGNFNPTFAGYAQQDSQEFMSFLLDGLHEDLNRNQTKPYTEQVESKGRPDAEVAAEQWRRHLLRNDSVVVDHCHGLLRSHLTCCKCSNDSITFDPFLSLSLPLPVHNTRAVSIFLLRVDLSLRPEKMTVDMESRACLGDVKKWISDQTGIDAERLVLTDVWQHKVTKTYRDKHPLSEVREDDDIWAHELASAPVEPDLEEPEDGEGAAAAADGEGAEGGEGGSGDGGGAAGGAGTAEKGKKGWGLGLFGRKKNRGDAAQANAVGGKASKEGYPADQYVDLVLMLERKNQGGYGYRIEVFGPPRRIHVAPGTTNADVFAKVREMNSRFLDTEKTKAAADPGAAGSGATAPNGGEDADGAEGAPLFKLVSTLVYNYQTPSGHTPIEETAEPFTSRASERRLVGVVYTAEGYGVMDDQEVRMGVTSHRSHEEHQARKERAGERASISLRDCFSQLTVREQLNETDMWYCARCKEHVRAYKKFDLWSVPDVLILHLKRFQYLPGTYFVHRQKLEDLGKPEPKHQPKPKPKPTP